MTLNEAFAIRVKQILKEKGMSQYRLAMNTGIYHSTITNILRAKRESSSFKTMASIIHDLGYTFEEFFDSDIFDYENLEF